MVHVEMMEANMGVKLEEMLDRLPADRRAQVDARTAELISAELSLRALRKAMGKTQVAVAKKLGMKQENVSRIEQRADVLLSTLNNYLQALGGRLRLVAEFPDHTTVTLSGFGEIKEPRHVEATPAKGKRSRAHAEA
jgi:transcriptional regulator with XRE-family HTH domain